MYIYIYILFFFGVGSHHVWDSGHKKRRWSTWWLGRLEVEFWVGKWFDLDPKTDDGFPDLGTELPQAQLQFQSQNTTEEWCYAVFPVLHHTNKPDLINFNGGIEKILIVKVLWILNCPDGASQPATGRALSDHPWHSKVLALSIQLAILHDGAGEEAAWVGGCNLGS